MHFYPRALGLLAPFYDSLRRFYIHFVPLSWVVWFFAVGFLLVSGERLRDSAATRGTPPSCTVAEYFERRSEFKGGQPLTLTG